MTSRRRVLGLLSLAAPAIITTPGLVMPVPRGGVWGFSRFDIPRGRTLLRGDAVSAMLVQNGRALTTAPILADRDGTVAGLDIPHDWRGNLLGNSPAVRLVYAEHRDDAWGGN